MRKILELPLKNDKALFEVKAGDFVLLNGAIYTARDQAHKRLLQLIKKGDQLPFELEGNFIYYCGPTPPRDNDLFGSAGPTTASRMDGLTIPLLKRGLKGMIGKGERSKEIYTACKQFRAVYLTTFGGAGAYLAKCIVKQEVIAFAELGAEAVYRLEVIDFPAVVAIDARV